MSSNSSLTESLHERTVVFGLKLWVVIGVSVGASLLGILLILIICITIQSCIKRSRRTVIDLPMTLIPSACKDIKEVRTVDQFPANDFVVHDGLLLAIQNEPDPVDSVNREAIQLAQEDKSRQREENNHSGSFHITDACDGIQTVSINEQSSTHATVDSAPLAGLPEFSYLGWGHWFTLRDLDLATDRFSKDNVIGEGGYGVVYRGRLSNGTPVAVKKILNNLGQAEREFRVEVEAIGHVRHKNLVRLLGYCVEGTQRMLVYEYVNNGNLESWLHGELSQYSSLTWLARMKILLGTAKALAYLHEAIEPKVVHRDIKSSNILIDDEFNAKISDFGLAKMLGAGKSHIATRVMGTFGYVAPEYANSGLLNEKSDVYSFGVVLLEAITGRDPIDYDRPGNEVNLVDWLKMMVANRRSEEVVDPNLERRPSTKELKRALLTALRCIDLNSEKRPRMDQVVRMLDSNEPIPQEERRHRQNRTPENSETEPLRGKNNSGRSDAPEREVRPPRVKSKTFSSK
ncbi:probable receptor-like protein kinase At5g18500 [Phragmites australis]|uniref:probable receptor-like protein kinase At5g18500 n=1 Tax=Phragmites australis TaxID=29695 RepID=UPI002D7892EA|nr:probable receptor-like protein kinase At5g18500 [Phragmites australis]XP_062179785.1 probable receptor-like protein kinase At5g18500 [Phragmites australis]XP_062179786.1 probable receptor-like protein kinase At5g18500 [Phragmites australis]XP_062179787.1 probable receptor-like protein kinase At5g18500 [Phragmites australis]